MASKGKSRGKVTPIKPEEVDNSADAPKQPTKTEQPAEELSFADRLAGIIKHYRPLMAHTLHGELEALAEAMKAEETEPSEAEESESQE